LHNPICHYDRGRVDCQALKMIRDRVAIAFKVAVRNSQIHRPTGYAVILSMMDWQSQDSNLPAPAVFLGSGREKVYKAGVLTSRPRDDDPLHDPLLLCDSTVSANTIVANRWSVPQVHYS